MTTETQPQHTPGPWHTHDEEIHTQFELAGRAFHFAVANALTHQTIDQATMKANARLIAAAPELLEALRRVPALADVDETLTEPLSEWWEAYGRPAIAKAERE